MVGLGEREQADPWNHGTTEGRGNQREFSWTSGVVVMMILRDIWLSRPPAWQKCRPDGIPFSWLATHAAANARTKLLTDPFGLISTIVATNETPCQEP